MMSFKGVFFLAMIVYGPRPLGWGCQFLLMSGFLSAVPVVQVRMLTLFGVFGVISCFSCCFCCFQLGSDMCETVSLLNFLKELCRGIFIHVLLQNHQRLGH